MKFQLLNGMNANENNSIKVWSKKFETDLIWPRACSSGSLCWVISFYYYDSRDEQKRRKKSREVHKTFYFLALLIRRINMEMTSHWCQIKIHSNCWFHKYNPIGPHFFISFLHFPFILTMTWRWIQGKKNNEERDEEEFLNFVWLIIPHHEIENW